MLLAFWCLTLVLLGTAALLATRLTRGGHVTPAGHALAHRLGLVGRRSVPLLIGSVNAVLFTLPSESTGALALARWSAGAAALVLLALLACFGLSAWQRGQGR